LFFWAPCGLGGCFFGSFFRSCSFLVVLPFPRHQALPVHLAVDSAPFFPAECRFFFFFFLSPFFSLGGIFVFNDFSLFSKDFLLLIFSPVTAFFTEEEFCLVVVYVRRSNSRVYSFSAEAAILLSSEVSQSRLKFWFY